LANVIDRLTDLTGATVRATACAEFNIELLLVVKVT